MFFFMYYRARGESRCINIVSGGSEIISVLIITSKALYFATRPKIVVVTQLFV